MGGSNRSRIAVVLQQVPRGRKLPLNNYDSLTLFQKLMLLRCFRIDRVYKGIVHYVADTMGAEYTVSPIVNYESILDQSSCVTPVVFILSPGADPAAEVSKLGERIGFPSSRLKFISLGQGQEEAAINMFQVGYTRGNWVMLQNCHLLVRFLHVLEKELEDMAKPHEEFRLWLTTDPIPNFPIGILQRSFKVVTEPPTGINLNMQNTFQKVTNESLHTCAHKAYHQLIYILTFFHSVVLDRRKYGKLGWNISYDFNHSDFDVCMQIINIYLNKTLKNNDPKIPWATLRYLIGEVSVFYLIR
ncbi:DNAH10 [Cordylochernes scorpioides]|uniref:DNAH10 n=1 Tax=Cordylochernes scorpioides TaxID=51811 RepID=A0ABY6KB30_9ARAC|nr:DNAH10 [Cordylochernes scorpioides]